MSSDGALAATKDAPVGGQAVVEGVMMRGVSTWAVAVRKPVLTTAAQQPRLDSQVGLDDGDPADSQVMPNGKAELGEIEVKSFPLVSWMKRHRLLRLPIIRGVVALAESMAIGFRALAIAANAQMPQTEGEEEKPISRWVWGFTVVFALAFAIGLFFVIPVGITSLIKKQLSSPFLFWLVEGIVRTAIFLGYLWILSRVRDLRRVFQYHGAEHKTISCYEAEQPLTPENAQRYSRLHPRCGTSFLLIVMVVAIFVFAPIGLPAWYWLVASRILGVPLIAGLSFELIKWAGRNRTKGWVRVLMWPGMQLQKLTTSEPDLSQLAVAIAAMNAVLAVENPREASAEDRVAMEVVA